MMGRYLKLSLGECCEIISGATPKISVEAYWDGEFCWATPKDLSNLGDPYIADTPRKISEAGLRSCAARLLPTGSVLLSSRAPIGHVAINKVPMATNQGFKSLIPDPLRVDAKYLYHWLRANRSYLDSLGNGATFKEVSKEVVSRVEIPLPEIMEQRRIAEVLDQAEALRAKRREALLRLDELTQSVFLDIFGDPIKNPNGWPTVKLAKVLLTPLRNGISPSSGGRVQSKVLTLSAITGNEFEATALKMGRFKAAAPSIQTVDDSDLLICRGNGNIELVGRAHFPTVKMPDVLFPDTVIAARVSTSQVCPTFLENVWESRAVRSQIEAVARTTNGTFKINQKALQGIFFFLPPLSVQQEFVEQVEVVGRIKANHRAHLGELDALFVSLQYRAFRGEL